METRLMDHQRGFEGSNSTLAEWYLEDHPMTCKWLITMVIVSHPKDRVILFQMAELHGMYLNAAQAIKDILKITRPMMQQHVLLHTPEVWHGTFNHPMEREIPVGYHNF